MKGIEIIINFIYRAVFGVIGIYFLNQLVQVVGPGLEVGLNAATVVITGALGIPGVVLLFAVKIIGGL